MTSTVLYGLFPRFTDRFYLQEEKCFRVLIQASKSLKKKEKSSSIRQILNVHVKSRLLSPRLDRTRFAGGDGMKTGHCSYYISVWPS